jgi:hypothetical protein
MDRDPPSFSRLWLLNNATMSRLDHAMKYLFFGALAAVAICWGSVASACLPPPPSLQKPGELDAQYRARVTAEYESASKESARQEEAKYFGQAKRIYLARVIASEEINVGGSPFARRITARPLLAIKGRLPERTIELKDREITSCGLSGDGPATSARVSDIAIVFDGVRNEGFEHVWPTYAILASEAQHPELVQAWSKWKSQAD